MNFWADLEISTLYFTWLIIAVSFADNLLKKRYEKADFVAPGPHAIGLENDKTQRRNICSCDLKYPWVAALWTCVQRIKIGALTEDGWASIEP